MVMVVPDGGGVRWGVLERLDEEGKRGYIGG